MKTIVFLVILSYVMGQSEIDYPEKPDRCHRPAEFMYRQCCVFPPFFTRDVAKICGAIFALKFIDKHNNVTGLERRTISACNHWRCVLTKYDLLSSNGTLDDEKYFAHLDKWVDLNPLFANVMVNAKLNCKQLYRFYMPLSPCDFFNFNSCIRNFINSDCPVTIPTKECIEYKEFFEECRQFFI